ncbi:MBOAT family O-acyltransferase [Pelagicoccus sp. SDUM812003]|uniref:MBOAT family O-acyltransferase n=1 Tax=Pelagicoccus sp. SDUM812003 TaxID=3041267 RepID=UPI00280E99AA|nr:MBOAT family O-acyltransferase [Pelagicoccus sp. SDUM812003]MDQ8205001.1 MBOAT family O-acyltransferase [Pelagicoccus sp. SDUM812003]
MLFNSFAFPIFFAVVLLAYWLLKRSIRYQNALLLISSYFFYGWWDPRFLTLIAISTALDYSCARLIQGDRFNASDRIKVGAFSIVSFTLFLGLDFSALGSLAEFNLTLLFEPLLENRFLIAGLSITVVVSSCLVPLGNKLTLEARKRLFVTVSVVSNLVILGIFKYFNFFASSLSELLQLAFGYTPNELTLNIILPVGISFYTFQTMSYTIDVYRGKLTACRSLLDLATYVSFFPQLVAGPIERGAHLLPQFQKPRSVSIENIKSGLWLILWGLYKKVVIADNVAIIVNTTFGPWDKLDTALTTPQDGVRILVAVYAFAFQIYCDFSGYSDIARGTSKLMGFDLMLNFKLPYFSRSPSEFWQRWHISLSSWLRDYLYIPLGGNRSGSFGTYRNLMLTMLLGGLWHGASWTFVLWGAYQGGILVAYRLFAPNIGIKETKASTALFQWFFMLQLTCIGWLIFRARNMETVLTFLESIFTSLKISSDAIQNLGTLLFYIWPLIIFQLVQYFKRDMEPTHKWHWFAQVNIWLFLLWGIISLANRSSQDFIYFAF